MFPIAFSVAFERECHFSIHHVKHLKWYVPESPKSTALQYYHNHPTVGHPGMTKTLVKSVN